MSGRNLREPAALSLSMAAKSQTQPYTKTSRCWPGYEPVSGKAEHEEGSCRKKPASRNGGKAVKRETARREQMARGGARSAQAKKAAHPRSPGKKAG